MRNDLAALPCSTHPSTDQAHSRPLAQGKESEREKILIFKRLPAKTLHLAAIAALRKNSAGAGEKAGKGHDTSSQVRKAPSMPDVTCAKTPRVRQARDGQSHLRLVRHAMDSKASHVCRVHQGGRITSLSGTSWAKASHVCRVHQGGRITSLSGTSWARASHVCRDHQGESISHLSGMSWAKAMPRRTAAMRGGGAEASGIEAWVAPFDLSVGSGATLPPALAPACTGGARMHTCEACAHTSSTHAHVKHAAHVKHVLVCTHAYVCVCAPAWCVFAYAGVHTCSREWWNIQICVR